MNRLAALLGTDRPVLLDGGMGTLLQDSGLEDGAPGELWNLENPDAVRAAHAAYAEAGTRLLTTNSFGGTRPRLDLHGLGDSGADDYLAGWERTPWTTADGTPAEVLDRVTSELDAEWPADRIAEYLSGLGR